jgi:single-stranded DNA-binding protein
MSDKIVQTLTGRIFKEPVVGEKSIRVEVVSNLYQKPQEGANAKDNTHPMYTTIVLTGGLMKLWGGRLAELVKGARVFVNGDWNFSLFTKKDGSAGLSGSIFPSILEVTPPRSAGTSGSVPATPAAATAGATPAAGKEDDLPF